MGYLARQLAGPGDPSADAAWAHETQPRKGFFTDTSICIGCKACEVACKEWNALPMDGLELTGNSYDNTGDLGASTWRHVAFVEQTSERIGQARESGARLVELGMPSMRSRHPAPAVVPNPPLPAGLEEHYGAHAEAVLAGDVLPAVDRSDDVLGALAAARDEVAVAPEKVADLPDFRWLMASDVCKHCTHAGCLDVCPTGALFRTEFGTVVVQPDVCNGCGYCVGACPFGVIERRAGEDVVNVGIAQKCTLCYDRISHDQTPACAQTCPTTSIKFGDHADMVALARERVQVLHDSGFTEARLYGANDFDGVGGTGSVFLLLDEPEVYGLPPDPEVPTAKLADMFQKAGFAATGLLAAAAVAFMGGRR